MRNLLHDVEIDSRKSTRSYMHSALTLKALPSYRPCLRGYPRWAHPTPSSSGVLQR